MTGAAGQQRVPDSFIRDFRVPALPSRTQRAIADFLDRKTRAIDDLIRKKERLIELLQEKRQALITQAVTKGLDPNVPMKDSGIPWLGEIPAHWEVKKLRWVLREPPRNGVSPPNSGAATVPTFSIAAVRDGIVRIAEFAEIDASDACPFRVGRGDVLVMRGNGSLDLVGSAGIVNEEPP
ncbi:MAG: restriction endonuclease subunit S, partial [Thermoanaerobaculia bacterium]